MNDMLEFFLCFWLLKGWPGIFFHSSANTDWITFQLDYFATSESTKTCILLTEDFFIIIAWDLSAITKRLDVCLLRQKFEHVQDSSQSANFKLNGNGPPRPDHLHEVGHIRSSSKIVLRCCNCTFVEYSDNPINILFIVSWMKRLVSSSSSLS